MRLTLYINESESPSSYKKVIFDDVDHIVDTLKRECKKFLSETKGRFFRRGLFKRNLEKFSNYEVITSKQRDRIPADTKKEIHDLANKVFKEKFGWKVRNGIFTFPYFFNFSTKDFLFFPIGNYRYVYSNDISDFYMDVGSYDKMKKFLTFNNYSSFDITNKEEQMRLIVNNFYTDKNLRKIKTQREVIFDTNYYYLISTKNYLELEKKL
jgi:hypothetical protein